MNPVEYQIKKPYDFSPSNTRKVTVQRIHRSARKVIIKRGIKAIDYWSYCNEIGCDVWGLLKSIRSISEEPVGLWYVGVSGAQMKNSTNIILWTEDNDKSQNYIFEAAK